MMDDRELLRRYTRERSEEAFAELVRRHVDFVYAAALRQTRNAHRAEDVAQTVFADLARKAAALVERDRLEGWLYLSTHYAATKLVRSEARRERREREASLMEALLADQPQGADWEKIQPLLDAALLDLSERDRTALLLRFFKNRSFAELGAALRISEEAARKRVGRALDKLHREFTRRGITSTAAALGVVLAQHGVVAAPAGLAPGLVAAALGGVATTSGSAATTALLWEFMSTTKAVIAVAGILVLSSIGVLVHESRQAWQFAEIQRAHERQLEAGRFRLVQAKERLDAAERRQAFADLALASLRVEQQKLEKIPPANAAASPANREVETAATSAVFERLNDDPEVRSLVGAYRRKELARRYQPLYAVLGLSTAQIARFEELLVEDYLSQMSWSGDEASPSFSAPRQPSVSTQQQIGECLGEAGYEQWQEFERGNRSFLAVAQLAEEMFYSATPLSAQQWVELMRLMGREEETRRAPGSEGTTLAQARAVLSPLQAEALERLIAKEDTRRAKR